MKSGRSWLSLGYLLANLLAMVTHDHAPRSADLAPESHGDCDERRQHVAEHEAPAQGQAPESCPSCQLRAEHPFWAIAPGPLPGPALVVPIDFGRPSTLAGSPIRTRCRAPPLA